MTPEPADFPRVVLLQVVDSLEVSPRGTRVGLVQYSSRVRTEFPLDMYHTADDIKAAVMKVRIPQDPCGSLRIPADPSGSLRIPLKSDDSTDHTRDGLQLVSVSRRR